MLAGSGRPPIAPGSVTSPDRQDKLSTIGRKEQSIVSQRSDAGTTFKPMVNNEITIPKASAKGNVLGDAVLSDEELDHLADVCKRIEILQRKEDERIRKIREIALARERNRCGISTDDGEHCNLCGGYFMVILNPKIECQQCSKYVCRNCIPSSLPKETILCRKCDVECKNKAKTGLWFIDYLREAKAAGRVIPILPTSALRSSVIRKKKENSRASSVVGFSTGGNEVQDTAKFLNEVSGRLATGRSRTTLLLNSQNGHESPEKVDAGVNKESMDIDAAFSSLQNSPMTLARAGLSGRLTHSRRNSSDNRSVVSVMSVSSAISVYSEREESFCHGIRITGDILFSVDYDTRKGCIRIFVKQARQIASASSRGGTSDTYVKTFLLPDKTKASKRKTKLRKNTLNPVFNQELVYVFPKSDLAYRTLQLSVWHLRKSGVNLFLGEVLVPLVDYPFSACPVWHPLQSRQGIKSKNEAPMTKGTVTVGLKFQPKGSSGKLADWGDLVVNIREASNLSVPVQSSDSASEVTNNPYAKLYLLPSRLRESKRKTKAIKKTNNPNWNTTVIYQDIEKTQLPSLGIELVIWDHSRIGNDEFLGCCRLNTGMNTDNGLDAQGAERDVWVAMMRKPNVVCEATIPLRPSLD